MTKTVINHTGLQKVADMAERKALPEWYSCYLPLWKPEPGKRPTPARPVRNHEEKEGFVETDSGELVYLRSAVYGAYMREALKGAFAVDTFLEPVAPHIEPRQDPRAGAHERLHITWRIWRQLDAWDAKKPRPMSDFHDDEILDAAALLLPRGPQDAVPVILPLREAREALNKYATALDTILAPQEGHRPRHHNLKTLDAYDKTVVAHVAAQSVEFGVAFARQWAMDWLGLRAHEADRTMAEAQAYLADKAADVSKDQYQARIVARLEKIIEEGMGQWGDRKVALRALKEQAVILGIVKQENHTHNMIVNLTKEISGEIHAARPVRAVGPGTAGHAAGDPDERQDEIEDFGGFRAALLEELGEAA